MEFNKRVVRLSLEALEARIAPAALSMEAFTLAESRTDRGLHLGWIEGLPPGQFRKDGMIGSIS